MLTGLSSIFKKSFINDEDTKITKGRVCAPVCKGCLCLAVSGGEAL